PESSLMGNPLDFIVRCVVEMALLQIAPSESRATRRKLAPVFMQKHGRLIPCNATHGIQVDGLSRHKSWVDLNPTRLWFPSESTSSRLEDRRGEGCGRA